MRFLKNLCFEQIFVFKILRSVLWWKRHSGVRLDASKLISGQHNNFKSHFITNTVSENSRYTACSKRNKEITFTISVMIKSNLVNCAWTDLSKP